MRARLPRKQQSEKYLVRQRREIEPKHPEIGTERESSKLRKRINQRNMETFAMVNAISGSSQAAQLLSASSTSGSSSMRIAALEKQIKIKESEAKEIKDPVQAAATTAELTKLRAELAKLQAAATKSETTKSETKAQESSAAKTRQAEFDVDKPEDDTSVWI